MIRNNRLEPKICPDKFDKKLVLISGATSGIGYFTAKKYASQGANLICINRDLTKSKNLKNEIENEFGVECNYEIADLSSLHEIHKVADVLKDLPYSIDVIIHNAGVYLTKKELTSDNLEKVFVVQYLASFIINFKLIEKLKSQDNARIILVNSEGHRFAAWGIKLDDLNWDKRRYSGLRSYGSAKLAQLLSMLIFKDLFENTGVTINAMHPGAVKTSTGQDNGPIYKWFKNNLFDRSLKSPEISAEALYYLGVSKDINTKSGKFFNLTTEEIPAPPALDLDMANDLWSESLVLGKLN
jgi:short-subunit dehydrogenase